MMIVIEFFSHMKFPHTSSFGQPVMFIVSVNVYIVRVKKFAITFHLNQATKFIFLGH